MRRLFLGFAPTQAQVSPLSALLHDCQSCGQPVPIANLHMTLVFLGMVSPAQEQQLLSLVETLPLHRFRVTLNQLVYWQGPKVLCLSGKAEDSALQTLAQSADKLAASLDLHQSKHTFTPHITLSRKAQGVPQHIAQPVITLTPDTLLLYLSHNPGDGVRYDVIQSWPLK
ncbi:MAG: RNA 2',3'-cyclic phosphodiesterase [Shewanella sp.]|nr:RNA 2',3'-cyclic phosphodiesterase [Shewanella sp.]MCF1430408.1 RNA 2',3'-cyclic phosphodiesterase [Shewanella sp.]MCF1440114.1 RNA 2',3'-cyclic phosphodiesterase [Shewanella sp.]MCF1457955.1 RNA 2',3'-cyclic phosphodiesterase [Shewanella sp.]